MYYINISDINWICAKFGKNKIKFIIKFALQQTNYTEWIPLIKAATDVIGISGRIPCPKFAIYRVLPNFIAMSRARSAISCYRKRDTLINRNINKDQKKKSGCVLSIPNIIFCIKLYTPQRHIMHMDLNFLAK